MSRTTHQDRQAAYANSIAVLNTIARDRDHHDPARRLVGLIADTLLHPEFSMGQQHAVLEQARTAADELVAGAPQQRRDVEDLLDAFGVQLHRTARIGGLHWLAPHDLPTGGIEGIDAVIHHGHTLVTLEEAAGADEEAVA